MNVAFGSEQAPDKLLSIGVQVIEHVLLRLKIVKVFG
tara:strand:- start:706 stop:816 length:111 start_codon:yes stop_codon:yes gene_type:complete